MRVGDLRAHEDVLGFRPEDAVRWLSPGELWRAGVKVVLSSVFASYADKREVQEALQPAPLAVRRAASGELWLDFVADLGGGFDATSTIAGLPHSMACAFSAVSGMPARASSRPSSIAFGMRPGNASGCDSRLTIGM